MIVSAIASQDLEDWQAYVDRNPAGRAMHHAGWHGVLSDAFSVRPHFLIERNEAGSITGVLPTYVSSSWLTGLHVASLDDGFLADSDAVATRLIDAALALRDQIGARYFLLRTAGDTVPREHINNATRRTVRRIVETAKAPETLFASLKSYHRRDIRRAEKRGYSIIADPALQELDGVFYDEFAAQMHRLGTPVMPRRMMNALRAHLGPELLRLFLLKHEEAIVGGMLCVTARAGWTAVYAARRQNLGTDYANDLLYWNTIEEASRAGASELDLGRNTPGSGVHRFKEKWPGEDRYADHVYFMAANRPAPDVEALYEGRTLKQRMWQSLPLAAANWLGPVLRRQLPFG